MNRITTVSLKILKWMGIIILSLIVFLFLSDGFCDMSLLGRYDYSVPYYNINGDMDYQTNYPLACEYYEQVNAPKKQMFVMKDATHGLLESRSEEFSAYLHQLAE